VTYPGTHGRDEVGPVNWVLHREWVLAREVHPLSARRAETTKIAIEDLESPSHHLRWALGVAAGALLAAGAFVASPLSGTGESTPGAAAIPEHTIASLEQRLSVTEPDAPAPATAPAPAPAPAPVNEQPQQETAPAATKPQAVAAQDPAVVGGENQSTAPSTTTPAPAPAPAQHQQWGSGGQWGSGSQWGYGNQWGSGSQWGYGAQQWRPVNGFGAPTPSSYSAAASTPTGPAMSMLAPSCHTMGR
jgi:hypothetical protein